MIVNSSCGAVEISALLILLVLNLVPAADHVASAAETVILKGDHIQFRIDLKNGRHSFEMDGHNVVEDFGNCQTKLTFIGNEPMERERIAV